MSTSNKKVILRSSDGETFEVDEAVASESVTIKNMIEDVSADNAIPLPNVDGEILSKVIEYCKKHAQSTPDADAAVKEELKKFDAEFVKVDHNTLCDLVLAANYLNIKGLLGLICQTIADMIKDKSPEEVRTLFNIENDYTQEEEEAVRNENAWAYE